MAHSLSAKKRIRQNEKHRLHNRSVKSELKTLTKKLFAFVEQGRVEETREIYPKLISKLDKAALRRVLHPRTVARRKSKATRLFNSVQQG